VFGEARFAVWLHVRPHQERMPDLRLRRLRRYRQISFV